MDKLNWLTERKKYLLEIIEKKRIALENMPDGILRVNRHGKGWQYYIRKNKYDGNGKYLRKDQFSIAQGLAQKEYDTKLIAVMEKELKMLLNLESFYADDKLEKIYEEFSEQYRVLIIPQIDPWEKYKKEWISCTYESKEFSPNSPDFYSEKGERMRSKSEVFIANLLKKYSIPYHYEKPLNLRGYGIVYPDFTILDDKNKMELYWEHLGMMGDAVYCEKALAKIACYEKSRIYPGKQLILTYESLNQPINMRTIENMIQDIL